MCMSVGTATTTTPLSESDEEVMVRKMRPPLRSVVKKAKKSSENMFLDVLKNASDSKLSSMSSKRKPLNKSLSIAADSSVIAAPTDPSQVQNSLIEYEQDLSTKSLPKASSTLLDSSNLSKYDSQVNSNSDTEHIVMKPKSKLLRRHNREMKKEEKNLFEDVLFRNTTDKDANLTIHDISTEVDESIEKPELQITRRSKSVYINENDSSETSKSSVSMIRPTFQGSKPRSKFLRGSQRSPRKNVFQNILDDSDSSTTIIISNPSEYRKSRSNKNVRSLSGRSRAISTDNTSHSDEVRLRLSNSSDLTNVDVARTSTKKTFSSQNNDDIVPSSQPPVASDRISAVLHLKSVLQKEVEKGTRTHSVLDNFDEAENGENANTSIRSQTITSSSQKIANDESVASELAPEESAVGSRTMQPTKSQEQLISAMFDDEKAVQNEEASLRQSKSPSKLQERSISRARNVSKAEQSIGTPSRRQTRSTAQIQEGNSTPVNDEKIGEVASITQRRSKKFGASRISSEFEELVSRDKSVTEAKQSTETPSQSRGKHSTVVEKRTLTDVDDEKIQEMKNLVGKRILKVSLTRIAIDTKTTATGSPSEKQSNSVSKSRRHVLKSVKENELVEADDVMPRHSQKVTINQENVPMTRSRQSQVKDSQSPERRQSKRMSNVENQPSNKRQSKRISKVKHCVTSSPVNANEFLSTGQDEKSNIFPIESRRRESEATVSEGVKTPSNKRSKLVDNAEEQTVPIAATTNETKEAVDTGQKRSQYDLRKVSNVISFYSDSDSMTENGPSETKDADQKQSRGNSGRRRNIRSMAPSKVAENTGHKQSPGVLKRMSKPGGVTLSDSKTTNVETSTRVRDRRISKKETVANVVSEKEPPMESKNTSQKRSHEDSRRQSKPRRVMSLLFDTDSEQDSDASPKKKQNGESFKKQTILSSATTEHKPMETRNTAKGRNRRVSKGESKSQSVMLSLEINDSKIDSVESATIKWPERASEEQTVAIAGTSEEPIGTGKTIGLRDRESRRQSELRRITSLLSSNDSDSESVESPNRSMSKRSISAKPTSFKKRQSRKQSSFRKTSNLVFADSSSSERESEHNGEAQNSMERSEQNQSKRQSYVQKETSLLDATSFNAENSFVRTMLESPKLDQSENNVDSPVKKSSELPISQVKTVVNELSEGMTLVSTKDSVSTPKKREGVAIKSIESSKIGKLDASTRKIGDEQRSSSRVIIDRNMEVVKTLAEKNEPGPSRMSGRPFSNSGVHNELDRQQLRRVEIDGEEKESRSEVEKGLPNVDGHSNATRSTLHGDTGLNKAKRFLTTSRVTKAQLHMKDFFKAKTSATTVLSNVETAQEIRKKLDEMKEQQIAKVQKMLIDNGPKLPGDGKKKGGNMARLKKPNSAPIQVHKAFLVNGKVYKQPRLPRPMKWITDRLYHFLWKRMQPKFEQQTRALSEKFVRELCEVSTLIARRKSYVSYKTEMHALMKEMARLQLIRTRHDFYNFCYDYLPYELRIKMVPMLLPGNQRNIPYEPDKLYEPLLNA
ncbi:uncharacterized protein LOC144470707 isoform X2 [Augochlora pura]